MPVIDPVRIERPSAIVRRGGLQASGEFLGSDFARGQILLWSISACRTAGGCCGS